MVNTPEIIAFHDQSQQHSIDENNKVSPYKRQLHQNLQHQIDMLLIKNDSAEENHEIPQKEIDRSQKGKVYAKNYREKKKELVKFLESQNRFLKQKIQDLSFRLKQTEVQLNKIKHSSQEQSISFQQIRKSNIRQIEKVLEQKDMSLEKLMEIEQNFRSLNTFTSRHKMGMLNYFMSELLQNLLDDSSFYFIDSVLEKKGFWKVDQGIPYRKIDEEILAFYDKKDLQRFKKQMATSESLIFSTMSNFKNSWKKMYKDYLEIIKQGSKLEVICEPLVQKMRHQDAKKEVLYMLKLELYFEKIKYRKDLRLLRESWFKEFQKEQEQKIYQKNNKKIKISPQAL